MSLSITTSVADAAAALRDAPSPVVVVPVYDSHGDVVRCLDSLLAHTDTSISILLVDDAGTDRRLGGVLDRIAPRLAHHVVVLQHADNEGFVRCCNDAFAATPGRDVVLVNSDVVVGPEWLDRLTAAALSDDAIATASTLTNHGTILSVPDRNTPTSRLPDGVTPEDAARRVAACSAQRRPTIPTAIGHCFYICRHVLDLIGGFDETFSPGYGEEVDFSQRAVARGYRHVCADDVFTYHRGGSSFQTSEEVVARRERHEAIVRRRYPWYGPWVARTAEDPCSDLADALGAARRALLGLTVGIDALCLGPHPMGTQRIAVETIRALARRPEISRLVAFVPERLPPYAEALRDELSDVEFIGVNPFLWQAGRVVDLVYRPYQVTQIAELDFLYHAGDRFVVNQLDTIAFDNPAYFANDALWLAYRDTTRLTLGLAHGVAFLSEYGRRSARAAGLLRDDQPCAVVGCGVGDTADVAPTRPEPLSDDDRGFLLCVGASYLHKNRPFALEVWAELRRRGWPGRIVLAGPTPPHGSSLPDEAEFALTGGELRGDIVTLDAISESAKTWLYQRAALVLYPSAVEGFGLVPFEAAAHGVPVLATRSGGLAEALPDGIPTLDGFAVGPAADEAWRLLHDAQAAKELVAALQARSRCFTWDRTAEALSELFAAALRQPRGRTLVFEGEGVHPVGLASREQRARRRDGAVNTLERLVDSVVRRPALKTVLSPNGSRRQQVARAMISRARRQLS